MTCQSSQAKHPTVLHIKRPSHGTADSGHQKTESNCDAGKSKERSITSALVSLEKGEETGAGRDCILAIVPVQVKVCNGNKTILTFTFLDPGSTATFCTEGLMRKLNARGKKTGVLLQTLGQDKPINSYEVSGLGVSSLEGGKFL